jgi:predicted transposase YbfD/YdcC
LRPAAEPAAESAIAIDGKTLRRTGDRARGLGPLHLVSAWASAHGLTLGQVAVDAKSNEITAIPELLALLQLRDCVVTIDAAGCQKEIAARIVAQEADYVLAVKENQPTLYEEVTEHFAAELDKAPRASRVRCHAQTETGHGRTETRQTVVVPAPKGLLQAGVWAGLATLVMVVHESLDHATGKTTEEVRYFISSLAARAKRLARVIRQHWGIENGLHWVLDVAFNEDRMIWSPS